MTDYKGIKSFDELIEREHGKIGTESRNTYEERSQMFNNISINLAISQS